jgi:hypothetical protein
MASSEVATGDSAVPAILVSLVAFLAAARVRVSVVGDVVARFVPRARGARAEDAPLVFPASWGDGVWLSAGAAVVHGSWWGRGDVVGAAAGRGPLSASEATKMHSGNPGGLDPGPQWLDAVSALVEGGRAGAWGAALGAGLVTAHSTVKRGSTLLQCALRNRDQSGMVRALLEAAGDLSGKERLWCGAAAGDVGVVRAVLSAAGGEALASTKDLWTALMWAECSPAGEPVRSLLAEALARDGEQP